MSTPRGCRSIQPNQEVCLVIGCLTPSSSVICFVFEPSTDVVCAVEPSCHGYFCIGCRYETVHPFFFL